ncbi:hypothetical protein CYLTODRAFT_485378 [Cylindrobasidium torrendii FP15055 ss-10]|uniref:CSC1/OSCA1-like 7TM region domain-containing protein n=1 Tax=Cylindrobasidium torrendii FP15055 ss-10 TaxID=1314674 RepID=A0A0D7BSY6_9AGAR|nr:hypothetical protein CYLTODRAFT_485378 [Cylindrobasidium torrendii FP15055 ss-10]
MIPHEHDIQPKSPMTIEERHWTETQGTTSASSAEPSTFSTSGNTPSSSFISGNPSSIPGNPTSSFTNTFSSLSSFPTSASSTISGSTTSGTAASSTSTPSYVITNNVCAGQGLDDASAGLLAAIVLPTVVGLLIWLIFAFVRPRFRQVYGLREWFLPQDARPKPLGSGFFAFLTPAVPLVPKLPADVSDAGRSTRRDAELFPADEQLSQRAIWICLLICLGWTILGLAGALPLYLVNTPCHADYPQTQYGGGYNTLQDLSLSRVLRQLQNNDISTVGLIQMLKRAADEGGGSQESNFRTRIIVLTVFALVLALLPALWKIIKEFNRMAAYRKRWIEVKCGNREMGWLSASDAPGFVGWGEKRLKDYFISTGLSTSLDGPRGRSRSGSRRQRSAESEPLNGEGQEPEIDVESLFSICDTEYIAVLIEERDQILEDLEVAETHYINSFRLTTPDPSIVSWEPPTPHDPSRPYISRPRPLRDMRRRKNSNPALAASSLASPTSFVAPSHYYKIRGVTGLTGGRLIDSREDQTLTETINSRVVGSRFQEVNRRSASHDPYRLGSYLRVDSSGDLGPTTVSRDQLSIPDPRLYGPNHDPTLQERSQDRLTPLDESEEGWIDVSKESNDIGSDFNGRPPSASAFRRRPKESPQPTQKRETFPFRGRVDEGGSEEIPPPHMRLQPHQPFVRPQDGINYDHLGDIYGRITFSRSQLKTINLEIADAQSKGYQALANGERIKGWLMVGRGLRHIPRIQLVEGRAKEDIRWDVLQHERTSLDSAVMWVCILVIILLLGCGLTAASGLALSDAPDFAHYLPFLAPIRDAGDLASGIATVLVPALAATVFICLALGAVRWIANVRGSVSVSGGHLLVFKLIFVILTATALVWVLAIGGILFSLRAFDESSHEASSVAQGSIFMTVLAMAIIMQVAVILPGLLLLQPMRLWRVIRAEKQAITPRQRFRALYPRTYDPSYATGACVLGIVFASTFSLIFPLIGPAVVLLLVLTLIAHRFLVGYVYARTHSQTGGLLQLWLLRRFGSLLALQPIFLGLLFLANEIWIEGGVLCGVGVAVVIFVEVYTYWKTRMPGRSSLSPATKEGLSAFMDTARRQLPIMEDEEAENASGRTPRHRGSMASVLEMMSLTLAVMPSSSTHRGPVPLHTETLDDLTATERAARTHPDVPPHLPPLPFTDHAEDMAGILYAPELIAPPPIIWLPRDSAGVAKSEAVDLQKYHDLHVTLDVRTSDDVLHRPGRTTSQGQR